ncbi:hypothetical protein ABW21_db0207932 [Orbilia brochopaga]|nr:hypothetical protein ABW21_db0207932 [Drechslerella brochopaga]
MPYEVKRAVFSAFTIQNNQKKLVGALEVGVRFDGSNIADKQVLFRSMNGKLHDITPTVTLPGGTSGVDHKTIKFSRPKSPDEPKLGFDIIVSNIESESTAFNGTFTLEDGTHPCTGQWVAFRSVTFQEIQASLKPIDPKIQSFLDRTPMVAKDGKENALDQAAEWAAVIYRDLLLHGSPTKLRQFFFPELNSLGQDTRTNVTKGDLPFLITNDGPVHTYLDMQKILQDNARMFELSIWHHVCHSLKTAGFLDGEFRDAIRDNIKQYYTMLSCPSKDVDAAKNSYGSNLTAANEVSTLRTQYADAIARCYYLAYICTDAAGWGKDLENPRGFYRDIREVVLKNTWIDQWLPKLISIQNSTGGHLDIRHQMGMLRDKLLLLEHIGKIKNPNEQSADVDFVMTKLADAVGESGIALVATMIEPDTKAIPIKIDHILSEESKKDLMQLSIMEAIQSGNDMTFDNSAFIESRATHAFLRDNATELGLYDWHFKFKFEVPPIDLGGDDDFY